MPKTKESPKGKHGQIFASWSFPEFIQYKRGMGWYFVMTLVGLGLLIWAVLSGNFLFALIIILIAIIVVLHSRREPAKLLCQITEDGLEFSARFYEWKELKKFWIIYEPPEVKSLYLNFKGSLKPHLSIPLQDQDPVTIRKILLNYLEEDLSQEHESTSDQFSRWLKL